jgi:hypothetical protein
MARGAWHKTAQMIVEIVNSIPHFGRKQALQFSDVDPFQLFDDDDNAGTSANAPYDPKVMQAIQDGGLVKL